MSADGDDGPGTRETAYRVFAAEFDDADMEYSESDEERAPNYVVTPTGARINRTFLVGVLTEVEQVNEEVLRGRIVDPTGAFVVYAGQYQPDEMAQLERLDPPTFVAVTGKARTFSPDDSDRVYTSVRPESINEVDADTRDRWVVNAAEQTVDRVATMAAALDSGLEGPALTDALVDAGVDAGLADGIGLAADHYGTTPTYLAALRGLALDAVRVVAGQRDEVDAFTTAPADDEPVADLAALAADGPDLAAPAAAETDAAASTASTTTDPDDESAAEPAEAAATGGAGGEASATEAETLDATDEGTTTADASVDDGGSDASANSDEGATAVDDDVADDTDDASAETGDGTAAADATAETDDATADAETTDDGGLGDFEGGDDADDDTADAADGDLGDFEGGDTDEMYELDEEERREVEEEFGTEFASGTEVEEPGEADIDVPDPDELEEEAGETDAAEEPATDTTASADEAGDESEVEDEAETESDDATETDDADEAADDRDLDTVVVERMAELDDGDGADREALIDAVVEATGAGESEVADAIDEALMSGQCYEPDDGLLKPI